MSKIKAGLLFGAIAGILDVIPMIIMKLTWDANTSAFVTCIIGGFLIATSNLRLHNVLKGVVIFFLLAVPIMILVGFGNPADLIPMLIMNLILGSFLGYTIGRFGRE
ncbi:MAG: hypothetical protein KKB81_02875 [Candidatus Margulisbacteria bacterium]|nr:hypothetical protein [Candidatus Margulisiibacteriota bacterium]MBU1022191.1 hypothetical protein [Candidatus Margulisiibacteriota bacterium]MBU1729370.1 hypothetical protein [Candidatus Margulisiibacteriota bacterium]MBU1955643.1 hypothetical protein [Candidatus Margulisiibacteriota bacterium]